jgi:hypothetical protein
MAIERNPMGGDDGAEGSAAQNVVCLCLRHSLCTFIVAALHHPTWIQACKHQVQT